MPTLSDSLFSELTGIVPNNFKESNDACAPFSRLCHLHWTSLACRAGRAGRLDNLLFLSLKNTLLTDWCVLVPGVLLLVLVDVCKQCVHIHRHRPGLQEGVQAFPQGYVHWMFQRLPGGLLNWIGWTMTGQRMWNNCRLAIYCQILSILVDETHCSFIDKTSSKNILDFLATSTLWSPIQSRVS